mmetsp:Transcript_10589/g.12472  ORF Transcript_10589/g.12472 Transcript_10589/m.12472 type:complete len:168 (-) Transcript_10589:92-595(-)|eukprot:CAMPEP_0198259016 /NCGR_PEP_ID=MMETSP1447-20131203/8304_1 /TAXON_ID=420782 /ORGANISM="Chaetoceros dichaeta, Strain CCMP1751" /LENGTH=167 /DNA_ID=CAMNT_0043946291 /DNA_START=100 /DNA_END=603 /DNA_ORIENTATION=+
MSVNEVKLHKAPFELQVKGTGHPGSRTFAIGDEDHTLGNSIRHVLMQNSKVAFAGYSVPHPSEPVVHIRVQTAAPKRRNGNGNDENDEDDRVSATEALKEACETLIAQCDLVMDKVEEEMPEVRQDRLDMEDMLQNDGNGEFAEGQEEDDNEFAEDDQDMDPEEEVY